MLNFDSNLLPSRPQSGSMYLPQWSTCNWFFVKFRINFFQRFSKLSLNNCLNVLILSFWSLLKHWLESFYVLFWQKLIELPDHLPQFNIRSSIFTEAIIHPFGSFFMSLCCDFSSPQVIGPHHYSTCGAPGTSLSRVNELPWILGQFRIIISCESAASDEDSTIELDEFA